MFFPSHEFNTKKEGMEKLKQAVELRDSMGGALYWNICNDDCKEIYRKLLGMGVSRSELNKIYK